MLYRTTLQKGLQKRKTVSSATASRTTKSARRTKPMLPLIPTYVLIPLFAIAAGLLTGCSALPEMDFIGKPDQSKGAPLELSAASPGSAANESARARSPIRGRLRTAEVDENVQKGRFYDYVASLQYEGEVQKEGGTAEKGPYSSGIIGFYPVRDRSGPGSEQFILGVARSGKVAIINTDGFYRTLLSLEQRPEVVALDSERGLLATSSINKVYLWDCITGEQIAALNRLRARVTSLDFHPLHDGLLIGAADGRIYRWRFSQSAEGLSHEEAEKLFERYVGHASVIGAARYHPYGRVFFSGDWEGTLRTWLNYDADIFGGDYDQNLFGYRYFAEESVWQRARAGRGTAIEHLVPSEDGGRFVIALQDGTVEVWQVRGVRMLASSSAHRGAVYALTVNADGSAVVTAGRDGYVKAHILKEEPGAVVGTEEYELLESDSVRASGIHAVALVSAGKVLLGGSDGSVRTVALSFEEPADEGVQVSEIGAAL